MTRPAEVSPMTGEPNDRPSIEHVVVLMLENRSFDHLLGHLNVDDDYDPEHPADRYWNHFDLPNGRTASYPLTLSGKAAVGTDPDHGHQSVMTQLGLGHPPAAPNSGFVRNYLARLKDSGISRHCEVGVDPGAVIMGGLSEEWAPALSQLARSFGVCTRWFSSVPGETWPNRNFVHAATSDGAVNIEFGMYKDKTIFEVLEGDGPVKDDDRRDAWRIYYEGPPQALAFRRLWTKERVKSCWRRLGEFKKNVLEDKWLPRYSFIEPNHNTPGANLLHPYSNSQHPNNNKVKMSRYADLAPGDAADFRRGDQLIAQIYETLRANESLFRKTILVITYDEHGGWFDHVAPPECAPPGDPADDHWLRAVTRFVRGDHDEFSFRHLGVRVPAVVVSPCVPAQPVRADFEHASVPRTLRELFAPGADPLTDRDKYAASFASVASLPNPRRSSELPSLAGLLPDAPEAQPSPNESSKGWVPDTFQRSLDEAAAIMNRHLHQPLEAFTEETVLPPVEHLRGVTPVASVAQLAASGMRQLEELAEGP